MADPDHPEEPQEPGLPGRAGRGLAFLALSASLAAAALAGYGYWRTVQDDAADRLRQLEAELAEIERRTSAHGVALDADLARIDEALATQQAALSEARAALAAAVAEQRDQTPPSAREWKLAEVDYLLRIANHRLLMERDAAGARHLLTRADEILAEQDDFSLHEVRALLAVELASLRAFKGTDGQGVFLRLEALKGLLNQLPLRLPEYIASHQDDEADPPLPDAQASLFDALLDRLEGLVRFRRHPGEPLRPLLQPEQADYLEQHLRLALDRAQLAVLRRDQAIFEASLTAAKDWLHRFIDPRNAVATAAGRELDALLTVELAPPLPDISASLNRLRELRRIRPAAEERGAEQP